MTNPHEDKEGLIPPRLAAPVSQPALEAKVEMRPCDVCTLLDDDATPKSCVYCPSCDAWMCAADKSDWVRRARSAAIKAARAIKGALS